MAKTAVQRSEIGDLEIVVSDLDSQVTDLEHIVDELREELDSLKREREVDRTEIQKLRDALNLMERFQSDQMMAHNNVLNEAEILLERLEKAAAKLSGSVK